MTDSFEMLLKDNEVTIENGFEKLYQRFKHAVWNSGVAESSLSFEI